MTKPPGEGAQDSERLVDAREQAIELKEAALGVREVEVGARERRVSWEHEAAATQLTAARGAREALALAEERLIRTLGQMREANEQFVLTIQTLGQTREANEQLVLTTLDSHVLAEQATRAQAAAEAAAAKLRDTEVALREANRRKDEFLAMLGHELRNPLAPILTALELMKLHSPLASVHEREVIERQVRHMTRLIDDLLDVSRIASGKIVLDRAAVELSEVVQKAVEAASPLLESRRHRLSVSVAPSGLAIDGDATRLNQVVANLLTNAAKYTDPGGVIEIAASCADGWVRLSVKDNGSGIAPELLPHVFDRFVQSHQTIDRTSGGMGLGLSIVRSMVELHGGTVTAHSPGVDQGAEFVVLLPALRAGTSEPPRAPKPTLRLRSARRVLVVVDDNVDAAEMLGIALGREDREVVLAHDGLAALDLALTFMPDAVVIDIGLPVIDGYEVARRLRERERREPTRQPARLIALTGYGQQSDRARSASAGMDVHLVKPVALDELEAALAWPAPAGDASIPS